MEEVWMNIAGYDGLYEVSNLGNVKSLNRTVIYKDGRTWDVKERILKQCNTTKGYLFVNLSKNAKSYPHKVHQLVAVAFIPNPENKPQVNHKDTIKTNNPATNLEWINNSGNQIHAVINGTRGTKLQVSDVIFIKQHPEIPTKDLANTLNVCCSTIVQIRSGNTWNHVNI
jgi:hypothetical protein